MKRMLTRVVIVVAVLGIGLFLARNFIARKSVEIGTRRVTGFPLQIGSVNLGLFNSRIAVRDIKLMNPPEFEERLFAELPHLIVDYRLGSMLRRRPHINDMQIEIKEMVLVKNSKGESNVTKLQGVAGSSSPDKSSAKISYRVDSLRLRVGNIVIKDYSRARPTSRTIPLNISATYHDITDSTDINRLVMMTVATKVRLPELGIVPEELKKGLGDTLKGTAETLDKAEKGLFDAIKQVAPQKD